MKALIDGDILLYRIGYTTEEEEEWIAIERMESMVQEIFAATGATDHCIYFSDGREETFRAKLYPEYKQNRTQPKPVHYALLKQYLINEYNTSQEVGQEADDGLGIAQTNNTLEYYEKACPVSGTGDHEDHQYSIICSIDKDLLQIPGHHYNIAKKTFSYVTEEEGRLFFYKQLLIGDTVDNVKGVAGIGQAKASKLLNHLIEEPELALFEAVQGAYRTWLRKEWCNDAHDGWDRFKEHQMNNIILLVGRLLKIRTKENEIWYLPIPHEEEHNG